MKYLLSILSAIFLGSAALAQTNPGVGPWINSPNPKTSAYVVVNTDCGSTITLGGAASYQLTVNAATGYTAACVIVALNTDASQNKTIAVNGLSNVTLTANQGVMIYRQGSAWFEGLLTPTAGGGGGTPGGVDGQVQINALGAFGASANLTFVSPKLGVGAPSSANGQLALGNLVGSTVTVQAPGTATYNFNLPTNAGTLGTPMLSGGGGSTAQSYSSILYPTSATSGGIPYFSSATQISSTSALTANGVMYGAGAGGAPTTAVPGTSGQLFLGVTGSPPQFANMSQDCTITSAGVITCSRTNNVLFGPLATQTSPCTIAEGCTGQVTAVAARQSSGLNIWGDQGTPHGDVNAIIGNVERMAFTTTTLTASRTWTLPAANLTGNSYTVQVTDMAGAVNGANTLVIARAGADTINGGTSITITAANGSYICSSDGISKWSCQATGPASGGGSVTNINAGAGLSTGTGGGITATGTLYSVVQPQGRLTLTTGVPVMTTNVTAAGTLFYDCYRGAQVVPYFNGTADLTETISGCEVSTAMVSAASAGQVVSANVYDVWWVHSGANRICLAMSSAVGGGGGWAGDAGGSNTVRGSGYSQLDFTTRPYITNKNAIANCFNGATNYGSVSANQGTYLGTIYATSAGKTDMNSTPTAASGGNSSILGVYNAYNRVRTYARSRDSTASWTYSSATIRASNGNANNSVHFVDGLQQSTVDARFILGQQSVAGTTAAMAGIGLNSTTTATFAADAEAYVSLVPAGTFMPLLGFNTINALEAAPAASAVTFGQGFTGDVENEISIVLLM